jgi:hypothetical protein
MNRLHPVHSYLREADKLAVERNNRETEKELLNNAHAMIEKLTKDKSAMERQIQSYEEATNGRVNAKDQRVVDYNIEQIKLTRNKLDDKIKMLEARLEETKHMILIRHEEEKRESERKLEDAKQAIIKKYEEEQRQLEEKYDRAITSLEAKISREKVSLETKSDSYISHLDAGIRSLGGRSPIEPAHIIDKRKRICDIDSQISYHEMTIEGFKKVNERKRNGEVLPPQILPPLVWTPSKENQELEAELERARASYVPDEPLGLQ